MRVAKNLRTPRDLFPLSGKETCVRVPHLELVKEWTFESLFLKVQDVEVFVKVSGFPVRCFGRFQADG